MLVPNPDYFSKRPDREPSGRMFNLYVGAAACIAVEFALQTENSSLISTASKIGKGLLFLLSYVG